MTHNNKTNIIKKEDNNNTPDTVISFNTFSDLSDCIKKLDKLMKKISRGKHNE